MEKLPEFIVNHPVLVTLFIAITLMLFWNLFGSAVSGIKQLSPAEATRMINHENAVLLDVRSTNDYKNGHILNSRNIPEAELSSRQEELEKFKKQAIIICCEHGNISEKAAKILTASGFEMVYSLKGGLGSWRQANLPVTRD